MIILRMTNGDIVKVPGVIAEIKNITRNTYVEEVVTQVVEIRDGTQYSSKIVATFKLSEVQGFEIDNPEEPEDE